MSREGLDARIVRGWQDGFGPIATALVEPATTAYRGVLAVREWLYARGVVASRRLPCVVVSIGNLTVGGTGKTPAVELAVRTLAGLGHRAAVVSRGYGRRSRGVDVVADTASIRLDPEDAGDEPFLLARRLPGVPVVVGADRREAARTAVERFGATAVVLDDGFQQRALRKDLEVLMVRARRPWGNGRLLPAGPLREPLASMARADLVVATESGDEGEAAAVEAAVARHAPGRPVVRARYVPVDCWESGRMRPRRLEALRGARVVAFAGIGSPDAFAATLAELGTDVLDLIVFRDHHRYAREDVGRLATRAARLGADALVTTEKDWVRLRRLPDLDRPLLVVSVVLELGRGHTDWRAAFERSCRCE